MCDGTEPIDGSEDLYRRVPESTGWYTPADGLKDEAFGPHKTNDATGLSLSRSKYKSAEQAAKGKEGKKYYVAVLPAGALLEAGIRIEPRPLSDDPSHCELPDLNSAIRKSDQALNLQAKLVELCDNNVLGPFPQA